MARNSPSGASGDWLLRATAKLQKSIFRSVEHKYKKKIDELYAVIKRLEDDAEVFINDVFFKGERIKELEKKLAPFENPEVTIKNVEKEVYRVIPIIEKVALEEKKKEEN